MWHRDVDDVNITRGQQRAVVGGERFDGGYTTEPSQRLLVDVRDPPEDRGSWVVVQGEPATDRRGELTTHQPTTDDADTHRLRSHHAPRCFSRMSSASSTGASSCSMAISAEVMARGC